MALGSQPMSKINNEQRKAFAEIVHDNGRAHEFYEKFGQSEVAKNRTKAQAILDKLRAIGIKVKALKTAHDKEEHELEVRQKKATTLAEKGTDKLKEQLETLGYCIQSRYGNDSYESALEEDTSRTNAEYQMYKKRTLASIWGADTLDDANRVVQKYLDLKK